MRDDTWIWAPLTEDEVRSLAEAERALDADYMIAYRKEDRRGDRGAHVELMPAKLDAAQLEQLRALERKMNAVVVAYQHG